MSVTYTDQVRPAAARPSARVDHEAYVPVYARSGARKSNKPVKTWMILAPLGVLVVGGAAAAMLMSPAETTAPAALETTAVEAAPPAPAVAAPVASPMTAATIPMATPAELTTATPIPPAVAAPVERRAAAPAAPARAARVAPRAAAPAQAVETPVPAGPQPYLSVAPQATPQATPAPVSPPVSPVTTAAPPAPIVITPTL